MRLLFLCGMVLTSSFVQSYVINPISITHRGNAGIVVNPMRRTRAQRRGAIKAGASVDLAPNPQITETLTAEMIEQRLQLLKENDKYDYESICQEFAKMKAANQIRIWDSVPSTFRRVSLGEVRMLTRGVIKEGTIDVTGEDDMQTLNFSFYSTLISSMILSLLAGCFIPDIDLPFMSDSPSHLARRRRGS